MSSHLNHYVDVDGIINVYENIDNIELNSIYSSPPLLRTPIVIAENDYYSHHNDKFNFKK